MLEIRAMQAEDLEAVARTESQIFSRPWSRKGFEDARGTLFFELARVVKEKRQDIADCCSLLMRLISQT